MAKWTKIDTYENEFFYQRKIDENGYGYAYLTPKPNFEWVLSINIDDDCVEMVYFSDIVDIEQAFARANLRVAAYLVQQKQKFEEMLSDWNWSNLDF